MLKSRLSILLAERNLKITKISQDTGISRTTLTSLFYNYAKGIQFDTLNTLCNYLNVEPSDIISFVPIEWEIIGCEFSHTDKEGQGELILEISTKAYKKKKCSLNLMASLELSDGYLVAIAITVGLWDAFNNKIESENRFILDVFQQIPNEFKAELGLKIIDDVLTHFNTSELSEYSLTWDNGLDKKISNLELLNRKVKLDNFEGGQK